MAILVCGSFAAVATAAGAATVHRLTVTSHTGSGGASTYLQSSATGSALQGEVASAARTSIAIPFGVLGEYDAAGTTFGIGVTGISTTGYGVAAESLSAGNPAVIGLGKGGWDGTDGYASTGAGDGVYGEADGSGYGLEAYSASNDGIKSVSVTNLSAAMYAEDDATQQGYGLLAQAESTSGVGVSGLAPSGIGVRGYGNATSAGIPALQAYTAHGGTELFDAVVDDATTGNATSVTTVLSSVSKNKSGHVYTSGRGSSDLQLNGDIYLTGGIYTDCGSTVPYATAACSHLTLTDTVRSSRGDDYTMYAAHHASETVEDEGEARLAAGVVHVALDPAFASVISRTAPYLVFVTPQGENRGLYVTNRTPAGFDVREQNGGRSATQFDYRIVARPFGAENARMALQDRLETGGGVPARGVAPAARLENQRIGRHSERLRKMPAPLARFER